MKGSIKVKPAFHENSVVLETVKPAIHENSVVLQKVNS